MIVWLHNTMELCIMNTDILKNSWQTIVIGGGQAGLATGFYLKKMKSDFLILDQDNRTGDSPPPPPAKRWIPTQRWSG